MRVNYQAAPQLAVGSPPQCGFNAAAPGNTAFHTQVAHGAFYSTISLPVQVYLNLAGKGLLLKRPNNTAA